MKPFVLNQWKTAEKQLAWLIDPDKLSFLQEIPTLAIAAGIDYFLIGGSLLNQQNTRELTLFLKQHTQIPVVLFPGNVSQVIQEVDAVMFLSMISGRNADLLIGQHVHAAPLLYNWKMEVIPIGYILIDSGKPTSVSYMSQTMPIPADKPEIVMATALAGQYLGLQSIYLEAGSGGEIAIQTQTITAVSSVLQIPLLVGGGIKNATQMRNAFEAGANIVVVGTAFEENPTIAFMETFKQRG